MSSTESLMRIVSSVLFAGIGYLFSSKIPAPRTVFSWVVFVLAILLAGGVMVKTLIVSVGDFGVYFNNSLQGLGMGVLCGFIVRGRAQVRQ
jgi:uncharacterized membrane protein YczE